MSALKHVLYYAAPVLAANKDREPLMPIVVGYVYGRLTGGKTKPATGIDSVQITNIEKGADGNLSRYDEVEFECLGTKNRSFLSVAEFRNEFRWLGTSPTPRAP